MKSRPDQMPAPAPPGMVYQDQPRRDEQGRLRGGWLAGPGEACRAADVLIEDHVGPPFYFARSDEMVVSSTHFETEITSNLGDGLVARYFTAPHPDGIR